ncbi:MAG TPA: 16S rRNA (adenine(1518)-N(6)/adenine(1519)-N(6))-dimethyltransferase RsmA [Clostridiales bacterium]|nr:16S rRNA (adenine(1518)-N(6)/adenine(1519)-N(6))-dimethyltransferase RsmA [Clostridiales bacterium]
MGAGTKETINKYYIKPTKSLGQNFLVDDFACRGIIEALNIKNDDLIIEIGAGLGALSKDIAEKAGRFIAVEIDKHLIPALTDLLKDYSNTQIINTDFLDLDIEKEIIMNGFKPNSIKVVGNLPYYITTPIIMKLLTIENAIDIIVIMIQEEVVDRILAKPGTKDYGALSVAAQYFSTPEVLFNVPPHCFFPKPKVSSSVVRLIRHKVAPVYIKDKKLFFNVVKASFGQRRKTLLNSLFNSNMFSLNKEEIKAVLKSQGIDENARGETLSIVQFAQISNMLSQKTLS